MLSKSIKAWLARQAVVLWLLIVATYAGPMQANSIIAEPDTTLTVLVPKNPVDCGAANPWHAGRWPLRDGASMPSGACLSLNITLPKPARAVLLHQASDGSLVRLWPHECHLNRLPIAAAGEHRAPQPLHGKAQFLELDSNTGEEHFHLLSYASDATVSDQADEPLLNILAKISTIAGDCASVEKPLQGAHSLAAISLLVEQAGDKVVWRRKSIVHY